MSKPLPQGFLRYPLTSILAGEGHVRVLRVLLRHGGELGVADLARRAGLSRQQTRTVLGRLVEAGAVDALGSGRSILYRGRRQHPLHGQLRELFRAEDERWHEVGDTVRRVAEAVDPPPRAVWLFGSAARGTDTSGSDVDIVIIAEGDVLETLVDALRDRLHPAGESLGVTFSVVGGEPVDVLRPDPFWRAVAAEAVPLYGPSASTLAARVRDDRRASS